MNYEQGVEIVCIPHNLFSFEFYILEVRLCVKGLGLMCIFRMQGFKGGSGRD